jgi:signal transduction histidine kinase
MTAKRSDRLIYLRVLAPLLLASFTLAVVSVGGFNVLSGARAFVGGESLWSKARGQTVARLRARAGGTLAHCAPMDEWLAVPLGDQAARLELDKPQPDLAVARAGFLRGGNLPGDVDGMISLYRYFGDSSLMRDAVTAWRHGDVLIDQLRALGGRICARGPGDTDAARMQGHLQELDRLDADLADVERRFSASLGDASRRTGSLLTLATVLIAVLLAMGSTWLVLRSLRAQLAQGRALLDANQRWELAADAADIGLFAWHPDQNLVELDARARRFYGFSPHADRPLLRREVLARIHPDDRDRMERLGNVAVSAGELLRARHRIIAAEGSVRHIEVMGMLRATGSAALRGHMFGVMRDVTDEVAASRLQLEKETAERSARARSEFLSRLSHELRTPLNAVLGLAQVLAIDEADPLSERQRQRVQFILDSGWHLLHLVDDVLDITSIDSGLVTVRAEPTDLQAVVRASLALVEPERARLGIVVVEHWPDPPALAVADAKRLQQVFANLLSNACKYNRPGGTVTLGCRNDGGGHVCVSIADEGPGIAAEGLAMLFQPFKRLAQTADIPGTGLGLVVVRLLVEQMNGRVEVTSTSGQGACFSVWLRQV